MQEVKNKLQLKSGEYIKDIVYAANDGILTVFGLVAGVNGASLHSNLVLILGFSGLLVDGLSMAASSYLGTRSEREYEISQRKQEESKIKHQPEEQRKEIENVYHHIGFREKNLNEATDIVTSNREMWLEEILFHKFGIAPVGNVSSPMTSAGITFLSFCIAGTMPLLPYLLPISPARPFLTSIAFTGIAVFFIGITKTYVTKEKWYKSGIEMLLVGILASFGGYFIAYIIGSLEV